MTTITDNTVTAFSPVLAEQLFTQVQHIAAIADVKSAVEANHDENRWWPTKVTDWRLRMALAGWSTRISYNMVDTYARVVDAANAAGYDALRASTNDELRKLIAPLGLPAARVGYFRSLERFLATQDCDPLTADKHAFIRDFAGRVEQAGFKVAQCAVLYARGYHSGVMPVDSGMVTKLAPCLGMAFGNGAIAHEQMRQVLEACVARDAERYRRLAKQLEYKVTIPDSALPTWWVHLVLIYFKRLYCNRPDPCLCPKRPVCEAVVGCSCTS